MIDAKNIPNNFYNAKATCCGLTKSTNGFDQFAIEVAIEIEGQDEPVYMTQFGSLDTDKVIQRQDGSTTTPIEITIDQAETCGCDTSKDIRQWETDPMRPIRVKIVADDQGRPKLKGIYPPGGSGGLIRKQAMDEHAAAAVATRLNSHIAALRAKRGAPASPPPRPVAQRTAPRPAASQATSFEGEPSGGDDIPF